MNLTHKNQNLSKSWTDLNRIVPVSTIGTNWRIPFCHAAPPSLPCPLIGSAMLSERHDKMIRDYMLSPLVGHQMDHGNHNHVSNVFWWFIFVTLLKMELARNDHREDAPHFKIWCTWNKTNSYQNNMSHHHYRLYPYEQLILPLIHMIPSDSFHKMILNGIRLMVPMMAAPLLNTIIVKIIKNNIILTEGSLITWKSPIEINDVLEYPVDFFRPRAKGWA